MMNDIHRIARMEHELRNAKFNNAHTIEGITVDVPNVFDRALAALRDALAQHRIKRYNTQSAFNRAVAR